MYHNINGFLIFENIFSLFIVDVFVGFLYCFFPNRRQDLKSKIRRYNIGWIILNIWMLTIVSEDLIQKDYLKSTRLSFNQRINSRIINTILFYGIGKGAEYLLNPISLLQVLMLIDEYIGLRGII